MVVHTYTAKYSGTEPNVFAHREAGALSQLLLAIFGQFRNAKPHMFDETTLDPEPKP